MFLCNISRIDKIILIRQRYVFFFMRTSKNSDSCESQTSFCCIVFYDNFCFLFSVFIFLFYGFFCSFCAYSSILSCIKELSNSYFYFAVLLLQRFIVDVLIFILFEKKTRKLILRYFPIYKLTQKHLKHVCKLINRIIQIRTNSRTLNESRDKLIFTRSKEMHPFNFLF